MFKNFNKVQRMQQIAMLLSKTVNILIYWILEGFFLIVAIVTDMANPLSPNQKPSSLPRGTNCQICVTSIAHLHASSKNM